jgi:hypothetical protein
MKSFDTFLKAKCFVFFFSLLVICVTKAQTPIVIQFDGQYPKMLPTKVAVCSDGGYILAQTTENLSSYTSSTPYLIKIDSMGGIEWYRHFLAIPGVSSFDKISRNVIPLPDSGFLYAGSILDFMFGTYEGSTFHRLDRFGNIISAKGPIFNWFFIGYGIMPCFVKDSSNTVMGFSHYYEYNGTNGPCCHKNFIWELDTNLNPVMVKEIMIQPSNSYFRIRTMQKIILNGTFSGYVAGSNYGSHVMMFDKNNNLLWSKFYGPGQINKIFQDDSTLVIIGVHSYNNMINAYIHRIDLNGNTLSFNELVASNIIFPVDIIRKDSTYLVAALSTPQIPLSSGYLNPRGLMISTDLTGNVIQAYCSSDSLFTFAGFDTLRKNFLFARGYDANVNTGFQILRLSFDSTACGFLPYNVTSTSSTITATTITINTAFNSLTMGQSQQLFFDTLITSSLVCGLTSLTELDFSIQKLEVYPNPANEFLDIKIEPIRSKSKVIIIYDSIGKIVFRKTLEDHENHLRISITDWHVGIYFIRYLNGEYGVSKKIIKN